MRQSKIPEHEFGSPGLSEQKRVCPLCDEVKTLRGLYGHLRLKHGKEGSELAELADTAIVDNRNDCNEALDLTLHFLRLWRMYDLLDEMQKYGCFHSEEVYDNLRKSVDDQMNASRDKLTTMGIVFAWSDENMENISRLSAISHDLRR